MIVYLQQECLIISGIKSKWSSVQTSNRSFQISNRSDHLVQNQQIKAHKVSYLSLVFSNSFSPRHVPPTITSTSIDWLCYYSFRLRLIPLKQASECYHCFGHNLSVKIIIANSDSIITFSLLTPLKVTMVWTLLTLFHCQIINYNNKIIIHLISHWF